MVLSLVSARQTQSEVWASAPGSSSWLLWIPEAVVTVTALLTEGQFVQMLLRILRQPCHRLDSPREMCAVAPTGELKLRALMSCRDDSCGVIELGIKILLKVCPCCPSGICLDSPSTQSLQPCTVPSAKQDTVSRWGGNAGKVAHRVKVLRTNPDNQSAVPGLNVMEGENWLL